MSGGDLHPSDARFLQTSRELEADLGDDDRCNVYRRLVAQLGENVVSNGWDGATSLSLMRDLMMRTSSLVDNPTGINNYSDLILNQPEKLTNHSSEWESELSLDCPEVRAMIDSHPSRAPAPEDAEWQRCMKIDLSHIDHKPKEKDLGDKNQPDVSSFDQSPPSKKFQFKTVNNVKNSESSFLNLPLQPKPAPLQQQTNSFPPRQSFAEKMFSSRGGGRQTGGERHQPQPEVTHPQMPGFRPASHQLGMDEKRRREGRDGREGITSSSYGGSRRQLGTRPGNIVAAAFKPPVRNNQNQGSARPSGAPRSYSENTEEEEMDPRYKNIDPKMVEMIQNEIMDAGQAVEWDDIAGLEFAKDTVKEIVVFPLLRPDIFSGLRGPPKGLLLFGPPGTGKTLIGKCIAHQSGCTFFSISASSLTSKWVGEGEKMVRALFAVARVHQPSVVFIDEIDSLLTSRCEGEHESSRKMKTEFLVQLDGASTVGEERVLVVGATNRPNELDEAARRRLVKRLYIPLPDQGARLNILNRLLGQAEESCSVSEGELRDISSLTEGYSGADMANLCREAALGPIRSLPPDQIATVRKEDVRPINHSDLVAALRQVKATVSQEDLELYLDWDKKYGATN